MKNLLYFYTILIKAHHQKLVSKFHYNNGENSFIEGVWRLIWKGIPKSIKNILRNINIQVRSLNQYTYA